MTTTTGPLLVGPTSFNPCAITLVAYLAPLQDKLRTVNFYRLIVLVSQARPQCCCALKSREIVVYIIPQSLTSATSYSGPLLDTDWTNIQFEILIEDVFRIFYHETPACSRRTAQSEVTVQCSTSRERHSAQADHQKRLVRRL